MGLTLLGVLPLSVPSFSFGGQDAASAAPRELQGFLLGATSAASSSPCATPVLVTVTSYLAAHQQSGPFSAVLLLAYALGYSTPLAVISLSASSLPWLQAGSRWGPLVSGAAILAVGSFQLLGAVREAFGAGGSDLLIEASAAVAVLLAVLLRSEAAEPAVVRPKKQPMKVVAVQGRTGLYHYSRDVTVRKIVEASETSGSADIDPADIDRRKVSLLSVCGGLLVASAAQVAPVLGGQTKDDAAQLIRSASAGSRRLSEALQSGLPTVIDFSATWCVECLTLAPTMRSLEERYGKDIQFVTI
ncbi:unnamed protein product, partial [Polarella glacialis]